MKTLSVILAILAGILIAWLLMLPLVLLGADRPVPYYAWLAGAAAIGGGVWVYKRLCSFLLKEKEVKQVVKSSSIDTDPASDDENDTVVDSEEINL